MGWKMVERVVRVACFVFPMNKLVHWYATGNVARGQVYVR